MAKKLILIFFLVAAYYLLTVSHSYAVEIQSPRFKIDLQKPDIDAKRQMIPAIYDLESLYGNRGLTEFDSVGYIVRQTDSDKPFEVSLSDSLINFSGLSGKESADQEVAFSASGPDDRGFRISLVQEYPLKNFAGDTVDLQYAHSPENKFRDIPNQNAGEPPTLILEELGQVLGKLKFRPDIGANLSEGTYETIINFIFFPIY